MASQGLGIGVVETTTLVMATLVAALPWMACRRGPVIILQRVPTAGLEAARNEATATVFLKISWEGHTSPGAVMAGRISDPSGAVL